MLDWRLKSVLMSEDSGEVLPLNTRDDISLAEWEAQKIELGIIVQFLSLLLWPMAIRFFYKNSHRFL